LLVWVIKELFGVFKPRLLEALFDYPDINFQGGLKLDVKLGVEAQILKESRRALFFLIL